MPDEIITITLPAADWPIIQAALYELPMKFAAPVAQRLLEALQEAQQAQDVVPFVPVKGKGNG